MSAATTDRDVRRTRRLRGRLVVTALVLAAVALTLISLSRGDFPMGPGQLLQALAGRGEFTSTIVLQWRLPRAVAAVVFGAALALSGAIFQTLTRNPLGSPDVLGFSTGAYTGVLLLTLVAPPALAGTLGGAATAIGALAGGLGTAVVVYLLARRDGVQGFRLIVVGIAVAAMLHAVNVWILLQAQEEVAMAASMWGAGTLSLIDWAGMLPVLVLLVLAVPAMLVCVPLMRQLELGDDVAAVHGVAVERTRRRILLLAVVLVAAVTALSGPIAFVALSAPQLAKRLVAGTGIPLGASAATGAVLLGGADLVAQHVLPTALPVGVVTIVLGGVYLVGLLLAPALQRLHTGGRYGREHA
ncbi:FecCD family ABC transporter permease [Brachybacterium fresconis]|uniref:Iron complex transport system permease protein n=1 Tax=Brachybacterium fresconis TaxID=173363 RepID=A0ABS4YQM9_9MICO|nr:iron chelate uptake ABC transporter family permease subunit [Brachybacterium fresconis]MBP2410895.1 iron complex transport system permease protein [Brachybacterium fresconis]